MRKIFILLFLISLISGCKKQVCVTCRQVRVTDGTVTQQHTACADSENEALRKAMDATPADSTAVLRCNSD